LILEFTDGRVVYKPRSLKIDNQFYLFTQYLLKRSVRKPKMIIREHYSWQEYIVPYSCLSKEEVIKYYYTLGMYSCIIYLLLGIDIHMENIIAEGSNPVLIDLETLFHNVRPQKNRNPYINTIFETAIFPINEVKR